MSIVPIKRFGGELGDYGITSGQEKWLEEVAKGKFKIASTHKNQELAESAYMELKAEGLKPSLYCVVDGAWAKYYVTVPKTATETIKPSVGGNPTTSPRADKEDAELLKGMLPLLGISTGVIVVFAVLVQAFAMGRRVYEDGQYLVSVRYPGQWRDLREFVQPDNPDVMAVYSQVGPDPWALYDFVCRNIDYRRDIGEFWQFPSEVLRGMTADCEDTAILLTSLIRAGGAPDAYVALGEYQGYGHAWAVKNGFVYETTYTSARPVPDPQDYCPYVCFNDQEVVELWPGALGEVFELRRDEELKLNLMAGVADGFA